MSCYYIGPGLNSVSEKVLVFYDDGKIDFETTKELLKTIRKGANWCDGYEEDAVECFRYCRCGKCLKTTKKLYDLYNVQIAFDKFGEISKNEDVICQWVCEDCYKEISKKYGFE
jgi:hypothetical protein